MQQISQVLCTVYLGGLSIMDIRNRKLSVPFLAVGLGSVIFYQIIFRVNLLQLSLAGAMIGVLFLGMSKVTKEAIGYGDSILILILGIYLGVWELLGLLAVAFFSAALFAVAALSLRCFHRKTVFPFVPFLSVGYLAVLCMGGVGK